MSSEQLVSRMQSYLSTVNVGKIVKKQLNIYDLNQIMQLAKGLEDAPIYIDDTPNISLMELKAKSRKLVKEHGVQLIIVDYLQLMRSGVKTNSRENEIAEISRGLKIIAKELKVPVIALSQLSRAVETRSADKKPQLSDLHESGQIEQDADMVMFCYRPEYYGIDNYEVGGESFDSSGLFMLLIAKHRNGELGEIPLRFIHEQTKLTNRELNTNSFANNFNNRTFVQEDATTSDTLRNTFNVSFDSETEKDDVPF
jgi:replicative DNA helicase